jgi:hypothetical protein
LSFATVNIDVVVCQEFNNVLVYVIIRDKLFENNDMISSILIE